MPLYWVGFNSIQVGMIWSPLDRQCHWRGFNFVMVIQRHCSQRFPAFSLMGQGFLFRNMMSCCLNRMVAQLCFTRRKRNPTHYF